MPVESQWKRRARWRRETHGLQIHAIAIAIVMALAQSSVHAQNKNGLARDDAANATVEQLKQATQDLLDAVAPGDVAVWRKYLAEDCIYADEEGNVKTKQDLLDELRPLPRGYHGSIKMGEPKVLAQENVIVLSHRDRESWNYMGRNL